MHTHRIGLVLEHDQPIHKNIHIPNSSARFSIVMFRQALTSLSLFLTEWSTFVLLEGQSYIKLIYEYESFASYLNAYVKKLFKVTRSFCVLKLKSGVLTTYGYCPYMMIIISDTRSF